MSCTPTRIPTSEITRIPTSENPRRDGRKADDERPPFRPGGGIKFEPIEYKPQGNFTNGGHKVRKKVEPNIKPNIVTSSTKRGGGGVYTPGVLFGQPPDKGESKTDRLFWEYVPDDYNIR